MKIGCTCKPWSPSAGLFISLWEDFVIIVNSSNGILTKCKFLLLFISLHWYYRKILKMEEEFIEKMCADVIALKPDLVITEKGVSDLAQHFLVRAGISCIRRVRKTDNNRIARYNGINWKTTMSHNDITSWLCSYSLSFPFLGLCISSSSNLSKNYGMGQHILIKETLA